MEESRLIEISDIIDSFDAEELVSNIHDQLYGETAYTGAVVLLVDYLSPIYYKFESILNDADSIEDVKSAAREKFYSVCSKVTEMICTKFHLNFDEEYVRDHETDLPAICLSLYFIFILHFMDVLFDVMSNYITKNKEELVEVFADVGPKKDMVVLVNKKHLTDDDAIIVANITNVAQWIFQNINEEAFIDYMNAGYVPGKVFRQMLDSGTLSGDFMAAISEEFHANLGLKSKICFNYYCVKADPGSLIDGTENL